jgi:uncharacterized membrane protein YfcA
VVDVAHAVMIGAAAFAGGAVNAVAGGGSLITFPVLIASGLPAIIASMTNTVAMCPGYLGAVIAQRRDLEGQGKRALQLLPLSIVGSLAGAYILLQTSEKSFNAIVPFLLSFAAILLALQGKLRRFIAHHTPHHHSMAVAALPVGLAAIYGAYFGAGMGVIILAILAVVIDDALVRTNALKQLMSLLINTTAAIVFLAQGHVDWVVASVIAVASLFGGLVGGKLATKIPEPLLRGVAIAVALGVAAIYFAKL